MKLFIPLIFLIIIIITIGLFLTFKNTPIPNKIYELPKGLIYLKPKIKNNILPSNSEYISDEPVQVKDEELLVFEPEDIDYYELNNLYDIDLDLENDAVNIYRDSQSVHDSHVQKIIRNDFKNTFEKNTFEKNTFEENNIIVIDDVLQYSKNNFKKDYTTTKKIIEDICHRNSPIINLDGIAEKELLIKTWLKCDNKNKKDQFILELNDCLEKNGSIVCPTGVTTRILSSLYIEEPEKYPVTKGILKQEMLQKASMLRSSNPDEDIDEFKIKLLEKYNEDYKDILTPEDIINETKEWLDYL